MVLIDPIGRQELTPDAPLLFLAGPIQGAPDHQADIARHVLDRRPDFVVATPRVPSGLDRATFDYNEQVDWEEIHLRRAAEHGGIAFWFAAQDHTLPYREGRAYAQTTRIELGMVVGWRRYAPVNIAVGFAPGYEGGSERYIRRMLEREGVPVAGGMEEFIEQVDAGILRKC